MEQVHETWERITGQSWPGGESQEIKALLKIFHIRFDPGSDAANLQLQQRIILIHEPAAYTGY